MSRRKFFRSCIFGIHNSLQGHSSMQQQAPKIDGRSRTRHHSSNNTTPRTTLHSTAPQEHCPPFYIIQTKRRHVTLRIRWSPTAIIGREDCRSRAGDGSCDRHVQQVSLSTITNSLPNRYHPNFESYANLPHLQTPTSLP